MFPKNSDVKEGGKTQLRGEDQRVNTVFVDVLAGEEAEELFETNWELEVDNFDDMSLKEEVLRGIYAFGFKEPSPIQQKGILPIIQAKDTIAQVNKIIKVAASMPFKCARSEISDLTSLVQIDPISSCKWSNGPKSLKSK